MKNNPFSFWQWFFRGSGDKAGFRRLINRWLLFHAMVGAIIAYLTSGEMTSMANTVLLPLAGIFVGLSFAWAGNAQSIMQSEEINKLAEYRKGGFIEYVYSFQTAILTIMLALVLWGLAGLNIFDSRWPTSNQSGLYFIVKAILFAISSLTLRECWHVVIGAQWLLIAQREIKNKGKN